jgi:O-antigen/teichoic acid export membrane protein
VGVFRPQTEVAIYGAAAKLVILVAIPLQIINAVVPPLIAEMYAQGKRQELERTLRLAATVSGVPAFLALAAFLVLGAPLLALIYGDYYSAAWTVLALLSLGQLVNVWVGSCGMVLTMTGHQVTMMVLMVISGGLTVAAGLLVVGRYGATGVAAATAGGIALQQILLWLAARSSAGIWTHVAFPRGVGGPG